MPLRDPRMDMTTLDRPVISSGLITHISSIGQFKLPDGSVTGTLEKEDMIMLTSVD